MKELSIEEKAKAYDEAREKIAVRFGSNVADEIFSKFEMSEDERIRKEIIDFIKDSGQRYPTRETKNKWIAWLEKQQKPVISYDSLREGIVHFGITQYQIDNWLKKYVDVEKQGKQKLQIEKLPFETETPEESLGIGSDTYSKIVDECIYGEQKPEAD